jgi:hypothetical protein
MSDEIVYDGGTDEDRTRLLEMHAAYLVANATFDVPALQKLCRPGCGRPRTSR